MSDQYLYWTMKPVAVAKVDAPVDWRWEEKRPLERPGWIDEWQTPTMSLSDYGWGKGGLAGQPRWDDFLGGTGVPDVCSPRLRQFLDERRGASDVVQWLQVWVANSQGEKREYWMLRLPELLLDEILDPDHTVVTPGAGVMKAVLDARKAAGRHILRYPYEQVSSPIVSEQLRAAVVSAKFTGCAFDPVPSSHRESFES